MATTPVEFAAPTGLTLTLKLFAYGSDTLANIGGDVGTEATNRKGLYSADVTEALAGWYNAHVFDGSNNLIALGAVYMEDDTAIKRVHDPADRIYDNALAAASIAANAIGASELAADAVTEIQAGLSTLTAAQIDTQLSTTHGAGAWGSSGGAGAFSVPLTIKESDNTTLIAECDVVITTTNTAPSTNVYASGRTNANGVVTFLLDAGTYYIWRQKAGLNFTDNPKTLTVSAAGVATVS